jgi:hypothetical protein
MGLLKPILFHLLLSFRRPILYLSKVLSLMFIACFGMTALLPELQQIPMLAKTMIATLGILFTAILWFYDYLVLHLKPKMLDVLLTK